VSALELDRVSYRYPGARGLGLEDVSIAIAPGELVVVAGASGSGKSTLLRAASGLVPHFYGGDLAGSVTVAGMDTHSNGPGDLARAVGTLFQDPETQIVMGTVRAELAFPLENRGQSSSEVARGVEEAALALGIAGLLDRTTDSLSGGELQRVALGAALAGRPQLVVLDEPTSQLDPVAGDELIALLRRCNEDFDVTVLLAEHRLERCLGAADRVIAMVGGGRVGFDGGPSEFLAWAAGAAPTLETPGSRLLRGVGLPPAAGVKRARSLLRERRLLPDLDDRKAEYGPLGRPAQGSEPPALAFRGVWHEIAGGPAVLRGVSLSIGAGERVALMGRNGAGKSTLLRHAAGLMRSTRGRVQSAGRVALLLQNPNDYLIHERVEQEAPAKALLAAGLDPVALADRHPRELSGGEKQRLALAIVLGDGADRPAVLCLDEPTRGMDRGAKEELASLLASLDAAVLVATHDPEFVAAFAQRVVLLADGAPIADGPVAEVLSGGTYFATETARILGGAGGALRPEEGVALIRDRTSAGARAPADAGAEALA
jgi:energy-coupling factor transport system ATP-binding protein